MAHFERERVAGGAWKLLILAAALVAPGFPARGADGPKKTKQAAGIRGIAAAERLGVAVDVRVPLAGWKGSLSPLSRSNPKESTAKDGTRTLRATLEKDDSPALEVKVTIGERARAARGGKSSSMISVELEGKADLPAEGVVLWISLPAARMAGGGYRIDGAPGTLPEKLPSKHHLWRGRAGAARFSDAADQWQFAVSFKPQVQVLLQDNRKWSDHFVLLGFLHKGALKKGLKVSTNIGLECARTADLPPVALKLDHAKVRYKIRGIGGNYCFGVNTPVTRYTLENLRPTYARTEMKLGLLKLKAGVRAPGPDDWTAAVKAADKPGSPIRCDLEVMKALTGKKIPFSATIWRLPSRMYTKPPTGKHSHNRIAPGKWNEVLDCIGAYLLYAKKHYGVEPDLFSFNEPNIAVWVGFNAEEHREAIKRIGTHLRRKGLKTSMLLADASPARDTHKYALPAAKDPEAMKHVGAVAFHSWGGASPRQYGAWADLARKHKLPLIVAEAGVDAGAWRDKSFRTFPYAVREMVHYQELFLHARPQAVLRWEYTADYSLVDWDRKTGAVRPTERYALQKHWCTFIPPGSENLATKTEDGAVLLTAFRHRRPKGEAGGAGGFDYSLHVSNSGPARKVQLTGLPGGITELNAVRTARGVLFRKLKPEPVKNGALTLTLPRQSLTTLTTLSVPKLAGPVAGKK
jgi:O-glycosyl hydrolase